MSKPTARASQRRRAEKQLLDFIDHTTMDIELVEAIAGDRELTPAEDEAIRHLRRKRGERFFCDLLFTLTHQYFPQERARQLWEAILKHKWWMSEKLGRNVGLQVAALDYLANVESIIDDPLLVTQPNMAIVAEVALRDGLTGLYDHRTFMQKLKNEMRRFHRYGNHISVIMLDIDLFKQYNDTHGHQAGDRLLVELSMILLAEVRDVDVAARYGGEEFAIILPRTDCPEAGLLAERIRSHTEERFRHEGPVTVSLGVATCPRDATSVRELVKAADIALYHSKQTGRNRSTCFDSIKKSGEPGQ